jgi:nucleoside-diphosphate-sugar epimerase
MKHICIVGGSGFVGTHLINYLKFNQFRFISYSRGESLNLFNSNAVIHLAGITQDLLRVSNPEVYYQVNTELTKNVFDAFLDSEAKVFITLSSVKAVADKPEGTLAEDQIPNPKTHYGRSKLFAEQYILSKRIPKGKRVYILRPAMIYGPNMKGNLKLLFKFVSKGIPWPLGGFDNKRSYCSIDNLNFIIGEFLGREDIPSGVYNVADDEPISTNEIISIMSKSINKKLIVLRIPKIFIQFIAKIGALFQLPFNQERLRKLTDTYIVSNKKVVEVIGKPLPIACEEGLLNTFKSLNG